MFTQKWFFLNISLLNFIFNDKTSMQTFHDKQARERRLACVQDWTEGFWQLPGLACNFERTLAQ